MRAATSDVNGCSAGAPPPQLARARPPPLARDTGAYAARLAPHPAHWPIGCLVGGVAVVARLESSVICARAGT